MANRKPALPLIAAGFLIAREANYCNGRIITSPIVPRSKDSGLRAAMRTKRRSIDVCFWSLTISGDLVSCETEEQAKRSLNPPTSLLVRQNDWRRGERQRV